MIFTLEAEHQMYVCICNEITEKDIKDKPYLLKIVGNQCGKCINSSKIINKKEDYKPLFSSNSMTEN